MEADRAEVDVGVAVDVEAKSGEPSAYRQPKKRFIGRRQAAELAARNKGDSSAIEESGVLQCTHISVSHTDITH
jgi:2-(3-amino-3-carboxypropyl)histidine synthase